MKKSQVDAVADAILEPHLRSQQARSEELRARQAASEALQVRKRRYAQFALVGAGIGGGLAYFGGFQMAQGFVWGGVAASVVNWLLGFRRI
ncbi:hypothetical protein [Stenotrophomonas bentonitica]|uniref:hypothetical protein n=1 Tax=Stenotrophomonas bentonitica TaxID=1450134 RepID=UPI00345EAC7A